VSPVSPAPVMSREDELAAPFSMVQHTARGDIAVTAHFAMAKTGRYEPVEVLIGRLDGKTVDALTLRAVRMGELLTARADSLHYSWDDVAAEKARTAS
jgi:hypothetical protein